MRYTATLLNGKDNEPTQEQLEQVWRAMEDAAEDGWLRPDQDGNVDEDVDEVVLRTLGRLFPTYLCGTYSVRNIYGKNPVYSFEQWED